MKTILTPRPLFLLLSLAALLTLSACSPGDGSDVTYVVITATHTPDPNVQVSAQMPAATAIPSTSVAPTPDIPPDMALRAADQLLLNGYMAQAVTRYQAIIDDPRTADDQRATAYFNQGRAQLRAGNFQGAVDALTPLIDGYPADTRAAQAYFLRGDAYLGLSRWTEAVNDFNQYLRLRPGIIDSYAHERIGDAYLAIGFFDQALDSYALATQSQRSLAPALALREKVARVYVSAGNTSQALAQYDAILDLAQNAPYRAQIAYQAAQTLIDSGDNAAGRTRLRGILLEYPDQAPAYDAMIALLEAGEQLDLLQTGRIRFLNADYQGAIADFNAYTTRTPLADIPAELYLLLGRAYRAVGNSPAALVAFDTIVKQYPTDDLLGDALLEQGRTRFLDGDIPAAIRFYTSIADNYGYLRTQSAQALWRAGYLHSTQGQYAESQAVFERLAEQYPESVDAVDGLGIAAAAAQTNGDPAAAERLFAQQAALASGQQQSEAYLQVGRLALARGDSAAADAAFAQAVGAAPDSYEAARAADLRAGIAPFTPPETLTLDFDLAQDIAESEAWLRATFSITQEGSLWPLAESLQNDPRLIRGTELWTMAAPDTAPAAYTEFYDLLGDYQNDPVASWQLALYFRGIAAYPPSMQGAANIITTAGVGTLDAAPFIARLRYPLYYQDPLLNITAGYGMDPLLLAALIRQESLFNTYATAAAGEKGLTQVIPSTGEYIAGQLAWADYAHSDLFLPQAGIAFGAYFLDENLDRFDGNAMAALSAYNAGPGRAIDWLQLSGGDPDLFLSSITISSTRLYVQLIYRSHAIYRALYG